MDVLSWLEDKARRSGIDPKDVLYSSDLQTICAMALGYNGGAPAAWDRIMKARRENPFVPWHETVFKYGVDNLAFPYERC